MSNYEFMCIINPKLSEEENKTSIDNLKKILKKYSAKVENEEVIGEQKLAYKINHSTTGFYVLMDLDLNGKEIKNISKEINLVSKNVWRYMFTKKENI